VQRLSGAQELLLRFGCRTLHRSREGVGFFLPAEHAPRQARSDRNRPSGKEESRIRKPAPLNTTRLRQPKFKTVQRQTCSSAQSKARNSSTVIPALRMRARRVPTDSSLC
jgi:hypothetical protein